MSQSIITRKELESLLNEHHAIIDKIEEIIIWWSQLEEKGLPKYGEMGMHIHELREMLAARYEDEEEKGYFLQLHQDFPELEINNEQFHEEHGEVCPAGWNKGDKGMNASPDGVASYLSENAEQL